MTFFGWWRTVLAFSWWYPRHSHGDTLVRPQVIIEGET
jgi:hypothetical protein